MQKSGRKLVRHCLTLSRRVAVVAVFAAGVLRMAAASPQPDIRSTQRVPLAALPPATLIYDQAGGAEDSRNFRTTYDLQANTNRDVTQTGLASLRASGSSAFTMRGLDSVMRRISAACARNGVPTGPVTIVDLRQESHGYLNEGVPISWMGEHDWANRELTHDQIIDLETRLMGELGKTGQALVSDEASYKAGRPNPKPVAIANAMTEELLVERAGAQYVRLTVPDHTRPDDAEVDRFLNLARGLPKDGWVHFHCHAGRGRTTTFLALWDMLNNADRVSLADITRRQSELAGGDLDLLGVNSQNEDWKRVAVQERMQFLKRFYEYAKTRPLQPGAPNWSEWVKSRGATPP